MAHTLIAKIDSARGIIAQAVEEFDHTLAVLTSFQREGVIIVDLTRQLPREIPVLTIETGRLPRATHEMIETVQNRYGIHVERILPDPSEVDGMVAARGLDLYRHSVPERMLCCNIRKVRPLAKRMKGVSACFTGLRRSQNAERSGIEFFDRSGATVKINPLADWSAEDVAAYTAERGLPEHPLYASGYTSIGCDPCTRAVSAGEDERAGRWWWEDDAAKECGLHFSADGRVERTVDVLLREVLEGSQAA